MLMGQTEHKSKQELIEESIQNRLAKYQITLIEKCEKDVQKRALEIVDSLLLKEAQVKTVDTFERPPKPLKPSKPTVKTAKDTTVVKPLFEN